VSLTRQLGRWRTQETQMSTIRSLNTTEGKLATARGLLEIAHFVYDHASDEDYVRVRPHFGFLLNAVSAELWATDAGVAELYREHFAANQNGGRR
jgi:hypothetical protein